MIAEAIDLSRFCSTKPSKYAFDAPLVRNGWRYATNNRICIRVPVVGEPDTVIEGPRQAPDFDGVFSGLDVAACIKPWLDTSVERGIATCLNCNGAGRLGTRECEACDGNGSHDCPTCGQDADCRDCDGSGRIGEGSICPECRGAKKCDRILWRNIGPLKIKGEFDRLISSLPNVRFQSPVEKSRFILFTFEGGQGAASPFFPEGQRLRAS